MYTFARVFFVLTMAWEISVSPTNPAISLDIQQLHQWKWENNYNCTKLYNFNFTERTAIFDCVLENHANQEEIYLLTFYIDGSKVKHNDVKVSKFRSSVLTLDVERNKENNNITCTAVPTKGTKNAPMLKNIIKLYYVPPTYTPTETPPKPSTFNLKHGRWIWTLVGCAVLLIICVVGCCAVSTRRKKPSPDQVEPTYGNLAQDDNYQTISLRDLRRLENTNHDLKPTAVGVDTYSEIQSLHNANEPAYIEPYKSLTYAVPILNDTYAEVYASGHSDSNAPKEPCSSKDSNAPKETATTSDRYALDEPYATPIPKARRMTKTKADPHIRHPESYMASSNDSYADFYATKDQATPKDSLKDSSTPKEPYALDEPYSTPIPKARWRKPEVKDYDMSDTYSELYIPKHPSAPEDPHTSKEQYAPNELNASKDSHTPKDSHASNTYVSDEPYATPIPKSRRKTRLED